MPLIRQPSDICTVIVTVDAEPEFMPELKAHARDGLFRFKEFRGFISGALHESPDGRRLVQYLQWETAADHLACINHPQWDDLPSTRRFMELVETGQARMDVRTYSVVSVADANSSKP